MQVHPSSRSNAARSSGSRFAASIASLTVATFFKLSRRIHHCINVIPAACASLVWRFSIFFAATLFAFDPAQFDRLLLCA
jgi:hypothetical protein